MNLCQSDLNWGRECLIFYNLHVKLATEHEVHCTYSCSCSCVYTRLINRNAVLYVGAL